MRLNKPIDCPSCKMQVNPYVIRVFGKLGQQSTMTVECASCGHTWGIPAGYYTIKMDDDAENAD